MKTKLPTTTVLLLALLAAAPGLAFQEVAPGGTPEANPLEGLEKALAAQPDDLRAASEYRREVIRSGEYDRALEFFKKLIEDHPRSANAWLNYGYAYVDKIPAAGSITQVILANEALNRFAKSIELRPGWLNLYTRGNSYLYWPVIFGRAPLGVADLEKAVEIVRREEKPISVHARVYTALGDGYWKTERPEKAREVWQEGLKRFPGHPQLEARLAREGEELEAYIYDQLDPNQRVDTDLSPLWKE
jgi:tetratricopeptide (TPR) repeat protein